MTIKERYVAIPFNANMINLILQFFRGNVDNLKK